MLDLTGTGGTESKIDESSVPTIISLFHSACLRFVLKDKKICMTLYPDTNFEL